MAIKVGLLGFGKTGSIVAKEIIKSYGLSLSWVCRKSLNTPHTYSSHALGYEESFAPFVSFEQLTKEFLHKFPVDIIIDFSVGKASRIYNLMATNGVKIVTAISKYSESEMSLVSAAAHKTAILCSPNISLGINWLMMASKVLNKIIPEADIEIIEQHFREKKEVSGSALKLAQYLDLDPTTHVNSIRVGGTIGKHEVIFGLPNQTIRLIHESIDRGAFGAGAVFASKWLINKENGLYSMEQVFHEKFLSKIKELVF